MKTPLARIFTTCTLLTLPLLAPQCALAQEWKLAPTTGHEPGVWKEAPNWTWAEKNPRLEGAGKWSLWAQTEKDPTLSSTYTPLEAGKAYGYFLVWAFGDNKKEPQHSYRDSILGTRALDGTPQAGPATVLRFAVPADGKYALDLAGTANVQNVTAGHARLTAYILSADGLKGTQLSAWDLNSNKPGAFGKFPNTVDYQSTIPLKKGEELAVRIQSVNPGPSSAGWSSFDFARLIIKQLPKE